MHNGFSPSRRAWNRVMTVLVWAAALLVMVLVAGIMIWVALAQLLPTAFVPAHRLPGILGAAAGCLLMLLGIAALP